jgi:hypothetical protein
VAAETAPGPFNAAGMSTEMLAISPRLAAAFNRSTLLIDSGQPDGEKRADYYTNAITNHYPRIVHATTIDGRGYAFPCDDLALPGRWSVRRGFRSGPGSGHRDSRDRPLTRPSLVRGGHQRSSGPGGRLVVVAANLGFHWGFHR